VLLIIHRSYQIFIAFDLLSHLCAYYFYIGKLAHNVIATKTGQLNPPVSGLGFGHVQYFFFDFGKMFAEQSHYSHTTYCNTMSFIAGLIAVGSAVAGSTYYYNYYYKFTYVKYLTTKEKEELEKKYPSNPYKYVVVKELRESFPIDGVTETVVVPVGFLTDGCSGGGIDALDEKGWLIHDWLYATHKYESGKEAKKKDVDKGLWHYRTFILSHTTLGKIMSEKAWNESYKRGPQFLD
jgi:hypothetical protein